jgi:hypothetical protein
MEKVLTLEIVFDKFNINRLCPQTKFSTKMEQNDYNESKIRGPGNGVRAK